MAASKEEMEAPDPKTLIELLAMFYSLQLCACLGFSKFILESDILLMVKEMKAQSKFNLALGNILKETKMLLMSYSDYQIQQVSRLGNEVAHRPACYGWNVENMELWWVDVVIYIENHGKNKNHNHQIYSLENYMRRTWSSKQVLIFHKY